MIFFHGFRVMDILLMPYIKQSQPHTGQLFQASSTVPHCLLSLKVKIQLVHHCIDYMGATSHVFKCSWLWQVTSPLAPDAKKTLKVKKVPKKG